MTRFISPLKTIRAIIVRALIGTIGVSQAHAGFIVFEGAGANPAAITLTRDAFRDAVGGGSIAGANGDFRGLRREINFDGTPEAFSDPILFAQLLQAPRGAVYSTPGTGFLVSASPGGTAPILFGFPNDLQTFSAPKLITPLNSPITDVTFFLPGTTTVATTSAFGLIFVDVEVANTTKIDFLDPNGVLLFTRTALVAGNQGLTFLGAVANAGEQISKVRITSGVNTIISNGVLANPNDDFVVMDDFLFANPIAAVPEPGSLGLIGVGTFLIVAIRKRL